MFLFQICDQIIWKHAVNAIQMNDQNNDANDGIPHQSKNKNCDQKIQLWCWKQKYIMWKMHDHINK